MRSMRSIASAFPHFSHASHSSYFRREGARWLGGGGGALLISTIHQTAMQIPATITALAKPAASPGPPSRVVGGFWIGLAVITPPAYRSFRPRESPDPLIRLRYGLKG